MKNYLSLTGILGALIFLAPVTAQAYNECTCNRYGSDGLCIDESCYTHSRSYSSYTHYLPSYNTPTYYTYPNYGHQYYPRSTSYDRYGDYYHYPRGHYRPYGGRTSYYRPYSYGGGGYYNPRRYNYYRDGCSTGCSNRGNGSYHYYDYHYRY